MKLQVPDLVGRIERRLLINFRADPTVVESILPAPFSPQVVDGASIVGICIIRLAGARAAGLPARIGITAEHVAHRIAVNLPEGHGSSSGVFVPRRDTSSPLVSVVGSRFFSGGLHRAQCRVTEAGGHYHAALTSRDHRTDVLVDGELTDRLPETSIFANLSESSAFFQNGSVGYSTGAMAGRFDGVLLQTDRWEVRPLAVTAVRSSFFADRTLFPASSVEFDHALVMTDIESRWTMLPPLVAPSSEVIAAA
jgi:Uncharacterized conserved protein (COG2071)